MATIPDFVIPAAMVRHLMRKHGVTIRGVATRFGITMKRVREVRATGARGFLGTEWFFMITGAWPDGETAGTAL